MKDKASWKVILQYALGILALILAVLGAGFGPDWYARWQDEHLLGETVMAKREDIRFLDVDSLNLAERMLLLAEADSLSWTYPEFFELYGNSYENSYSSDYNSDYSSDYNIDYSSGYSRETDRVHGQLVEKARRLIDEWQRYGILPEGAEELIPAGRTGNGEAVGMYTSVLAGQNVVNTVMLITMKETDAGILGLMMIMDADTDTMYYAAVYGERFWDWMARSLGPEHASSYLELQKDWIKEQGLLNLRIDTWGDLAGVSGASSCETAVLDGEFDKGDWNTNELPRREFILKYDQFEGKAMKQFVYWDGFGYGAAVMLGTPIWNEMVQSVVGALGAEAGVFSGTMQGWLTDPYGSGTEIK